MLETRRRPWHCHLKVRPLAAQAEGRHERTAQATVSQSLNAALILAVVLVAVVVAQRFDYQLRRAELAYEQRQTKTMLGCRRFITDRNR